LIAVKGDEQASYRWIATDQIIKQSQAEQRKGKRQLNHMPTMRYASMKVEAVEGKGTHQSSDEYRILLLD